MDEIEIEKQLKINRHRQEKPITVELQRIALGKIAGSGLEY